MIELKIRLGEDSALMTVILIDESQRLRGSLHCKKVQYKCVENFEGFLNYSPSSRK